MLNKNKGNIIILILILVFSTFTTSCSNSTSELSVGDNINEIYNYYKKEQIVSLNYCAVISSEQNIIVDLNEFGSVVDIEYLDKVTFNSDVLMANYATCNFDELISLVGAPTFIGLEENESIDFLDDTNNIYRLYLKYNGGDYMGYKTEILDKESKVSWLDSSKSSLPCNSDIERIKVGMTLEEVIKIIGKPQRDIGSGGWIFEFDILDGSILRTVFNYNFENDSLVNEDESSKHNLYLYEFEIINK